VNNVSQKYAAILLIQRFTDKNLVFIGVSAIFPAFHPNLNSFISVQIAIRREISSSMSTKTFSFLHLHIFIDMKKALKITSFLVFAAFLFTGSTACSKKTGCPVTETVHSKTGKDGSFKKKKGNSNLFPKDMRRGN